MPDKPLKPSRPMTVESPNPYAPSATVGTASPELSIAETIRKKHLSHEASVKSIGLLYGLGAVILIPVGLITLAAGIATGLLENAIAEGTFVTVVGAFYLALGLFQAFAAYGLRRLTSVGRICGIVLSIVGLIGFPIGTLISAYFLYLLIGEQGKVVFSEPYRQVILQTPHITYKTSIFVWILLGILLLVLGLGVLAGLFLR